MNPNWRKATFTMTDEDFRESAKHLDIMFTREKIAPWILKWFMGKGRPKYRWQVWLSNNWPTKEIPKERQLFEVMKKEMAAEIDKLVLEEIHKKILETRNDRQTNKDKNLEGT